jgi:GntP family gluconate:H+ symporter
MSEDLRLILAALLGIGLAIALIVRGRFHPFLALLCGAFAVGIAVGMPMAETAKAVQKGAGDVLGGTGLVVALGLSLGAMLQLSDGAGALARGALRHGSPAMAPWLSMAVALLIGLPLFFETGVVLLLPIAAAAAAAMTGTDDAGTTRLRLLLPALAGLSTLHALVPPHPGPLLAVDALHASLPRTMLYGLLIGVPTAIVSGPLFALWIARRVRPDAPVMTPAAPLVAAPGMGRALLCVLLPVVLIAAGQVAAVAPPALAPHLAWLGLASNPVLALVLANLVALPLLFGRGSAPRQSRARSGRKRWRRPARSSWRSARAARSSKCWFRQALPISWPISPPMGAFPHCRWPGPWPCVSAWPPDRPRWPRSLPPGSCPAWSPPPAPRRN